jgi:hypothetical protein
MWSSVNTIITTSRQCHVDKLLVEICSYWVTHTHFGSKTMRNTKLFPITTIVQSSDSNSVLLVWLKTTDGWRRHFLYRRIGPFDLVIILLDDLPNLNQHIWPLVSPNDLMSWDKIMSISRRYNKVNDRCIGASTWLWGRDVKMARAQSTVP